MRPWEQHLDEHRKQAEETLKELLSIPSVSTDRAYEDHCVEAAEWVQARLTGMGFEASLETIDDGHPIVAGRYEAGQDRPTVTLYGHYDVQPPDPVDAWTTPPFEPTVFDGKIRARGATDDKGQMLANLLALEAHAEAGTLDVNVNVLIEGEEEMGGPSLPKHIQAHEDELQSDGVFVSDTHLWDEEHPAIVHGMRGIVTLEATVTGPERDMHSGQWGGIVMNPAEALAKAVASLKDEDLRVAIPGFYDDVLELDEEQRELMDKVPFDEEAHQEEAGVPEMVGEAGFSSQERLWARPSLEINGISSGYAGDGFKTVLPSTATVKISSRIVPDQDPDQVGEDILGHLQDHLPDGVTMTGEVLQATPAWYVPPHHDILKLAAECMSEVWGGQTYFIREGATIPVVPDLGRLGPVALMGYGMTDERLHAPDEFFRLEHFHNGAKAFGRVLERMADRGSAAEGRVR